VLMGAEETTSRSWHCRENCCCTGLGRNVSSVSKKGRRFRTVRLQSLKLNRRRLPRGGCSYIYLLRAMAQDRVKAHQGHPGRHGHGAVDRCCADRAAVSEGQALPTGGRRSPERVWTLLALPLESLPAALTVKGAGGRRQQGRKPTLVLMLAGWLLFR
jgi:hypothetical protein